MKIKVIVICILTLIFFSLQYVYSNDTVATFLLGGLAISIFAIAGVSHLRFSFERFPVMVLAFVVFCLLSYTWAARPSLVLNRGLSMLKIYIMIFLLYVSLRNTITTNQLLKIIMWGGFFGIIYVIFTVGITNLVMLAEMNERLGEDEELFINVNVLGTLAANVIIINTYFKLYHSFSWDIVIDLPCLAMVAVCGSRRAIIVLFAGILILLFSKYFKKLDIQFLVKVLVIIVVTVLLIYYILSLPIFAVVTERMEGLVNSITGKGTVDNSTLAREAMMEIGYKLFQESPILGVGLDNARVFNIKAGAYLHNNYAELAADLGIIGFVLYYIMHGYIIIKTIKNWKHNKPLSAVILTLIISLLLSDIGVVSYYYKEYYFYLILSFIYIKETNPPKIRIKKKLAVV